MIDNLNHTKPNVICDSIWNERYFSILIPIATKSKLLTLPNKLKSNLKGTVKLDFLLHQKRLLIIFKQFFNLFWMKVFFLIRQYIK